MADALGRTVMHRDRYGRVWGLGDRKAPASQTPGLVLMEDDPSLPLAYAPFISSTTDALPAVLRMASRGAFNPPQFDSTGPTYEVNVGHVLPPSLEDANAGEAQGTPNLLPVSWQRMNHDDTLTNPMLAPEIVVLTDAVQLASQPGKLPTAVMTLKHRFPGVCGRPGWVDRTILASWCPWALTCLTSHDAARRQPMAFSSRHGDLAFPWSMSP